MAGGAPEGASALLLQLCQRCLTELSAVRHELRELKSTVSALQGGTSSAAGDLERHPAPPSATAPSSLGMVGEPLALAEEDLVSTCCIEDAELRRRLVTAFATGEIAVELGSLLKQEGGSPVTRDAIVSAARGGSLLIFSNALPSWKRIEELIDFHLGLGQSDDAMRSKEFIAFSPTFRRPSRSVLKGLLRSCAAERLNVPIKMFHAVVSELMGSSGSGPLDEVELVAALNDLDAASVSCGSNDELYVAAKCQVLGEEVKAPLDPFAQGLDSTVPELALAQQALAHHRDIIFAAATSCRGRGVVQLSDGARDGASPPGLANATDSDMVQVMEPCLYNALPIDIVLTLLGPLRIESARRALGLSDCTAFTSGHSAGAVLWALNASTSSRAPVGNHLPAQQVPPAVAERSTPQSQPSPSADTTAVGQQQADAAELPQLSSFGDVSKIQPFVPQGVGMQLTDMRTDMSNGFPALDPMMLQEEEAMYAQQPALAALEAKSETDDEKRRNVQAMFTECFRDDLLQDRRMLMSQINNLFKMRNQGESLQYKHAGYDKLHDFLVDIPGLALTGLGNRMEVKVGDPIVFEEFCNNILDGVELPSFEKPKPVPESFQLQVIEVFRRSGCREIPARNFREYWNMVFPDSKLQCKDFGYRDVKGLLANVGVLDRVGGKYSTKYVLKCEIEGPPFPAPEGADGAPTSPHNAAMAQPQMQPAQLPSHPSMLPQFPQGQQPQSPQGMSTARQTAWGGPAAPLMQSPLMGLPNQPPPGPPPPAQPPQQLPQPGPQQPQTQPQLRSQQLPAAPSALQLSQPLQHQPQVQLLQHLRQQLNSSQQPAQGQQAQQLPQSPQPLPPQPAQQQPQQGQQPIQQQHPAPQQSSMPPQPQALPQPQCKSPMDGAPGLSSSSLLGIDFDFDTSRPKFIQPRSNQNTRSPAAGDVPSASGLMDAGLLSGGLNDRTFTEDAALGRNLFQNMPSQLPLAAQMSVHPGNAIVSPPGRLLDLPPAREQDSTPSQDPADLMAAVAEHKRKRKEKKAERAAAGLANRSSLFFVSSPGALSSEDRDVLSGQGRFDMGALCQAQLRTERHCLIVDFATGRVLFSNQLCNNLFGNMIPLPQKDVAELIHAEERQSFSASLLYLNIGNFTTMEPQVFHILSATGVQAAVITGEQLAGTWWWLVFSPCDSEA
eukprot:CAMPEP_0178461408 /NCGR_PEP_ID=MMETSP0689_2-20121128/49292_1 /TAXON_ID=160604 /ORGANISM="Amphidinium massartii, Strain CS-259" /LENGTH=1175 /DNA_ID=CAMNT_0020088239 /DNA_START=1 /DNA_END=3524 /DNA_ORIENTATION=+